MTYIIIDFEATCCDENTVPRDEMEIIEWGVVAVDEGTLEVMDEFSMFVRPVRHPILTSFCNSLTSITQDDVDKAHPFTLSLELFVEWMKKFHKPTLCSWGNFDKNQLEQDCKFHAVEYPFGRTHKDHINIKHVFTVNNKITKRKGLGKSLQRIGATFEGTQHRGIDDARNMVKLLPFIFGDKVIKKGKGEK